MDSNASVSSLADVQELGEDGVAGRAAVDEEQVVVREAHVCETLGVVHLLVEPDDGGDVVLSEVGEIRFRRMKRVSWRGGDILIIT